MFDLYPEPFHWPSIVFFSIHYLGNLQDLEYYLGIFGLQFLRLGRNDQYILTNRTS
jgi:hypothetical protein